MKAQSLRRLLKSNKFYEIFEKYIRRYFITYTECPFLEKKLYESGRNGVWTQILPRGNENI